ncbi:MAG: hypothetical protein KDD45_00330 [Bdellovibrionales bacterium]|nr:hypothetical protein [Bdellovibrionales bacterium]
MVERLSIIGCQSKDKKPYHPVVKQIINHNRLEELSQPKKIKTETP